MNNPFFIALLVQALNHLNPLHPMGAAAETSNVPVLKECLQQVHTRQTAFLPAKDG
jgi:hypothetical protein